MDISLDDTVETSEITDTSNYEDKNENNNAKDTDKENWWESVTAGHNFGKGPSNDYSIKVWF
jgi:hypothetical protein